jgi:hypothetical protein
MNPEIQSAISNLEQSKARLQHVFDKVPQDKLNWSPSATARTPLQIVAHCGAALGAICDMLDGNPYPAPDTATADAELMAMDRKFSEKPEVSALVESNYKRLHDYIATMDESRLSEMVKMPFGLGEAPMTFAITAGSLHTDGHIAQLEYIQTIYGDRVW